MAGRTATGLDIGTSAVRVAQVKRGRNGETTLERYGELALPPGTVRDGEVVDVDGVAQTVRKLWSQTKVRGRKVVLGVANQKVVVRQVDLPWMPLHELRQTLAFHVQDFIPMAVDEAVLDFHPTEEVTDSSGTRLLRGLLVAASRPMVDTAVAAAQRAGLTPVMIDLAPFALLRAVGTPDDTGLYGHVEALVDVGARVTNVVVHESGVPKFVRILLMGGDDVVEAVAERVGIQYPQAREMAWSLGLALPTSSPTEVPAGAHGAVRVGPAGPARVAPGADVAARALDTAAGALVEEIRSSLDYYVASSGSAPIRRTLLTGGGGRLAGLQERLQVVTRTPVELGRPLAGLSLGKVRFDEDLLPDVQPSAAVPVGLALGALA